MLSPDRQSLPAGSFEFFIANGSRELDLASAFRQLSIFLAHRRRVDMINLRSASTGGLRPARKVV